MRVFLALALVFSLSACSSLWDSASSGYGSDLTNGRNLITGKKKGDINISQAIGAAHDLTKAAMVTEEDVNLMAQQFSDHADKTNKIAPQDSRYSRRLERLTSQFTNEDGLNLDYKVFMSPDVNALSTANGSIRVFSGLMDMMRDEELLAVIGHEIGHVKLGHTYSKTRTALLASAARKGVASMNSTVGHLAATDVGALFQKVATSQYSQAKERASDAYSLRFLMKHGYDGQGAVNAMYKLARLDSDSSGGGLKLLSSHPAPRDRAKRLASMLLEAKSNPQTLDEIIAAGEVEKESDEPQMVDSGATKISSSKGADFVDIDANAMRTKKPTKTATLKSTASPRQEFREKALPKRQVSRSEQPVARGYYLQVSAETDEAIAQRKIQLLEAQGFKVTTQNAVVRGVLYKRLLLGPFSTRYQALNERPSVNLNGINDGEPFVKRIK